ncbi:MAG TPA: hypothetical protein VF041_06670 [Gemmatimonadaceae bacterium]
MILVRNVFRLKYGKAREAVALWKEGLEFMQRAGRLTDARLLTDLTGPFYTLVLESTHESLGAMEREMSGESDSAEWREWYQRFVPLVDTGFREVFTIVGTGVSPTSATMGAQAREGERAAATG